MITMSEIIADRNARPIHSRAWLSQEGKLLTPERLRTLWLIALSWALLAVLYMLPNILRVQGRLNLETIISHLLVTSVGAGISVVLLAAVALARCQRSYWAFFWSSISVLAVSAILSTIDLEIFAWVYALFDVEFWNSTPYEVKWTGNFAVFMSKFSLIAVAFWTLETLQANQRNEVQLQLAKLAEVEAVSAANTAKLTALRFQLNPHFLFNTLNSISSLVVTKRNEQAEDMLGQLSEFLRITLVTDADAPQTLERELETVGSYVNIERARFGTRLAIDIQCPPDLRDAEMPGFLLQPLVENSIKYGVSNSYETVTIRIEAMHEGTDLVVVIEDDGPAGVRSGTGHGIGLRNVRERLEALYGSAAHLEVVQREHGFLSVVRLPFAIART